MILIATGILVAFVALMAIREYRWEKMRRKLSGRDVRPR
jgi:hypothetical protein